MRAVTAAAFVALAVPLSVRAQTSEPWEPIAKRCIAQITKEVPGCTNCNFWPQWALCTAHYYYGSNAPQQLVKGCISRVWEIRLRQHACTACGDPLADTMACIAAGGG